MTSTSDEVGHTATPWSVSPDGCIREGVDEVLRYVPLASAFDEGAFNYDAQAIRNAAFIVNAVNSHDSLVKALEDLLPIAINDGPGGCDGKTRGCDNCEVIRNARAALSQAKGGK